MFFHYNSSILYQKFLNKTAATFSGGPIYRTK